ncbi:MAG: fimbria/pilus outer membrane usher protein [Sphingomonas sp.]|nr:fimbria/pilus outer membrane usher protein [Sphingomonas sp.]
MRTRLCLGTSLSLALASLLLHASPAIAQENESGNDSSASTEPPQPSAARARLNPTGRDISLTAPIRDGAFILGEIDFILGADDSLRVNAQRLLTVLLPALDAARGEELVARLSTPGYVTAEELAALGYAVRYVPATISLEINIPAEARTRRQLRLTRFGDEFIGEADPPAGFAGYINFRTFTDYQWNGPNSGFSGPTALIDSAFRYRNFVLENEATLRLSGFGRTFVREGTRVVYDDRNWLARWTAGDLRPISRGFSGTSQMLGASLVRIYSVLEPQRNVQPRGDRNFTLTRPSTIEAVINGQSIRRIRLDPGTYDLRDFPFVQGANNVQIIVEDDAGGREVIEFSAFFDRTLLSPGLTEFGVFAGFRSRQSNGQRAYDFDEPVASGFFRRGITDRLTAGGNFNAGRRGAVIGGEIVAATPLGTLGADLAFSKVDDIGTGFAFNTSLLYAFSGSRSLGRSVGFTVEHRSRNFANPNELVADNRFAWDLSVSYSQALDQRQFVAVTGQYSIARGIFQDEKSVRVNYGFRVNQRLNLTAEATYEDRAFFGREYGVRVGLIVRFGPRSSGTAEYDSRFGRARVGYQTSRGDGVGAWAASGEVSVGEDDVGLDGNATYYANRAELGLNHASIFDISGRRLDAQRTSVRLGTALVFADGNFALSRPIYDSFVMVRPHPTLGDATVYINPQEDSYTARSGTLGPAVEPNLSAYIERVVNFDVPNAPIGYDLGRGNVRVFPPYRSGYLVTAGSDYSVTVVGTLLDTNGQPVSLLAGRAIELAEPDRPAITVFTNRTGRFGIAGLRPGRWRIEMPTQPATFVIIDVPDGERGVFRAGDVQLGEGQ